MSISHDITIYTTGKTVIEYKVYIDEGEMWTYDWSPIFTTLKDLDEYLSNKIEGYKKVY
jgi:hypothetical protein